MANNLNQSAKMFGFLSMFFGTSALLAVCFHFWAGPLEPQKSVERSIAEIAVNISKEVVRVARDQPAIVESRKWTIDDTMKLGASLVAILAIVAASVGFVKREDNRPLTVGVTLGSCALAFQFVTWVALLVTGLVLIWVVTANLSSILGSADLDL